MRLRGWLRDLVFAPRVVAFETQWATFVNE
jgi:hypothetical protein